jgi:addiction module RelE/StbE family toxin
MKKYNVQWTKTAKKDLDRIIGYIAEKDSLSSAGNIYVKIKNSAQNIELFPNKGRIVPELARHNIISYREFIISPWRMIYRIENKNVYILAVIDGRRNIEDILIDRFLRE